MDVIQWMLPQVDELIVCSPTFIYQNTWDPVRNAVTLHHDSLEVVLKTVMGKIKDYTGDDEHKVGEKVPVKRLIVMDDVTHEKTLNMGSKGNLNALVYNAVWWNISLVVICHHLTSVGAGMRENCEHFLLFPVINDKEVEKIYDNFSIVPKKKDFVAFYKHYLCDVIRSGKDRYPFIFICYKEGGIVYSKFNSKINLT